MCPNNMFGKHNFSFGELSQEEIKRGCVTAVVCLACNFRTLTTNKISERDRLHGQAIAELFKEGKIKSLKSILRTKKN